MKRINLIAVLFFVFVFYFSVCIQPGIVSARDYEHVGDVLVVDFPELENKVEFVQLIQEKIHDQFSTELVEIENKNGLNIFQGYQLLDIELNHWGKLRHSILPGGCHGLFLLNSTDDLIYLEDQHFENVLWEQRKIQPLTAINPQRLATLIMLCKVTENALNFGLIQNIEDIFAFEKYDDFGGGYEIKKDVIEKYREMIKPPLWEEKEDGTQLIFYSLTGWMHNLQCFSRFIVSFSDASPELTIRKEVLEEEIFSGTPQIMY